MTGKLIYNGNLKNHIKKAKRPENVEIGFGVSKPQSEVEDDRSHDVGRNQSCEDREVGGAPAQQENREQGTVHEKAKRPKEEIKTS